MAEAALKMDEGRAWTPRIVKVSSKRQITIPADVYKEGSFANYALLEWNGDELSIKPLTVRNEAASVTILRSLVDRGLEGDVLVDEYEKIISDIIDFNEKVKEGLRDIEEGRTRPYGEFREEIRRTYGF